MKHLEFCQNKFPCETASSANTVRVLANAVSLNTMQEYCVCGGGGIVEGAEGKC